jgi:hypothetical protein
VSEKDNMTLTLAAIEKDTFDPDDLLAVYRRTFSYPPEAWVGTYEPDDENPDLESTRSWRITYHIQSLKL